MHLPAPYDHLYGGPSLNSVLHSLLPEELRAAPLDEIDCNGFLTREQLDRIYVALEKTLNEVEARHRRILDIGCGTGGLARYLAANLHCTAVGIDLSASAVSRARTLMSGSPIVEFVVGDFSATDVEESSVAAIISLDAVYLAADPHAALLEARRIIVPGGSFIFTTYSTAGALGLTANQWCVLAEAEGFEVSSCLNCTGQWRDLMWRKHEQRVNSKHVVRRLLGERAPAELQVSEAMIGLSGASFIGATERAEITLRRMV